MIFAKDIFKDAKLNDKTNLWAIPIAVNHDLAKQALYKLIDQVSFGYIDVG